MKFRLWIAVVICLLGMPAVGAAELVTSEEAMVVGSNFLEHMTGVYGGWGKAGQAEIVSVKELRRGDVLLGYHLSVGPGGHMVVSPIKMLSPVKSFSFTDDFDTDAEEGYWLLLKDAMQYTLLAIEERYGKLDALGGTLAPAKVGEQWDWLLGSGMAPASVDTLGPLVKTKWDQGEPFNNNCPDGDGGRCVVGCVATAGCQVMRYWRHPSYGTGSCSYYWNGDQSCGGSAGGGTLSADFDHAYDWWNMKRNYTLSWTPEQGAAVAEFCSDVGIAWQMDYGRCGSGAFTAYGITVYPAYFKYLNSVVRHNRSDYATGEDWFARIREELAAKQPRVIHYRIQSHSIVCDGYIDDGTNYIHLNYGWADSHDDWYAVDELYCSWSGCDPMVEYMLVGIEPGADFIDATSSPLNDGDDTFGAAWGDYDGDGDQDLYITNDGTANKLFRNDGGTFTDVTSGPLGDTGDGRAGIWGDFDNDGDLDLYVTNGTGQANKLLRNDGGTFVDATSGPLGDLGAGESAAWGDYNNDGQLDLYMVNNGGANKLLMNNLGGVFVDATVGPLGDTGSGHGVAWGDYDGDGDLDLYIANDGANKLLSNDGLGNFSDVTSGPLGNADSGRGVAWGDYDNDGDLDIYLANYGSANNLFRNDGAGTFTDVTAPPLGDAGNGYGVAWGDYDNDGDLDIYHAKSGAGNEIYRNNGDGTFKNVTVTPLNESGDGRAIAWGDYDGDGLVDLYTANTGGANHLFHNEYQPDNHWLHVKLVGTLSNYAGIGARVEIFAGGLSQIREVSGGSGYCSQNSLIAAFGVGEATMIDSIRVMWPSGFVFDTTAVAADQLIQITEDELAGVPGVVAAISDCRLLPSCPNPFDESTAIRYVLAEPASVSLRVYDVSGRMVRVLVDSAVGEPGEHTARWDGTNSKGEPVAGGVYFYRLDAGRFTATRSVVFLR